MSKWKSIETAPKDGTTVLLWGRYCDDPAPARWNVPRAEWEAMWDCYHVVEYMSDFGTDYRTFDTPSHWMPLPEPPEAA